MDSIKLYLKMNHIQKINLKLFYLNYIITYMSKINKLINDEIISFANPNLK